MAIDESRNIQHHLNQKSEVNGVHPSCIKQRRSKYNIKLVQHHGWKTRWEAHSTLVSYGGAEKNAIVTPCARQHASQEESENDAQETNISLP